MRLRLRCTLVLLLSLALPGWQARGEAPSPVRYAIDVTGLSCDLCAHDVRRRLRALPAVERVEADYERGTLTVVARRDDAPAPERVFEAVAAAGHEVLAVRLAAPRRVAERRLRVGNWSIAIVEPEGSLGATVAGTLERAGAAFRLVVPAVESR